MDRARLVDPLAINPAPHVLARGDQLPAPLADLAGSGRRVIVCRPVWISLALVFPLVPITQRFFGGQRIAGIGQMENHVDTTRLL